MGEKLKNALSGHKEKKKSQSGGFSYMLASSINARGSRQSL